MPRPRYDGECFNPATGAFQDGCDPGFACVDNKCDFLEEIAEATEADSSSASGCSEDAQCSVFGEYCDSDLNECRAPIDGECYDAASGVFTDGCAEGYECLDGLCQVHTTTTDDSVCYLTCSAGEYCENGANECRSPGTTASASTLLQATTKTAATQASRAPTTSARTLDQQQIICI